MSQENVEIVRAAYEEWEQGDLGAGVDRYDRHVLFIPLADFPDAGLYLGTEAFRGFMRGWLEPFTNFTISAEEFIEAGDSVVVAAHQRAVGQESGAPTDLRYFHVWTFRGRLVIRLELFRDRADALEAVGLSE